MYIRVSLYYSIIRPLYTVYDVVTPFTTFLILIPYALYSYEISLFVFVSDVRFPFVNVIVKPLYLLGLPLL